MTPRDPEGFGGPSLDLQGLLRGIRGAIIFAGFALVLTLLNVAEAVVIPIALAVLLSFLLSPLVRGFEHVGLGRVPSLVLVVVLAFSILGGVAFGVFTQVTRLADELPAYRTNIRAKVADLQGVTEGGLIDKFTHAVEDVMEAIDRGDGRPPRRLDPGQEEPVPVVVEQPSVVWNLPMLLEGLASAGLVFVLVLFMLHERRELRDRLIRLAGYGRLAVTTRALDEAAGRISRYLLAQSAINAGYGVVVGVGLYFAGVPYALLWGFLAAVLRFIPYLGPWLGAGLPILLALVVFPGWTTPLMVAGLFAGAELVTNMIVEPLAYGQSAGVSQVALLAAVAFWTWLWGPIGLVLATPLTVCVVVLSKNVPELQFVYFLMSDEPVLEPDVRLYQRLLAGDRDEALEVVKQFLDQHPDGDVYDDLILPALSRTGIDRERQRLSTDEERRMLRTARELVAELEEAEAPKGAEEGLAVAASSDEASHVLGVAVAGDADELLLHILAWRVARDGIVLELLWSGARSLEVLSTVENKRPRLVCIVAMPPRGPAAARSLCRRLRQQNPEVPLLVVAWRSGKAGDPADALCAAGASVVVDGITAARDALIEMLSPATAKLASSAG